MKKMFLFVVFGMFVCVGHAQQILQKVFPDVTSQGMIQLSDFSYMIAGIKSDSLPNFTSALLIKLDSAGNTQWSKVYHDSLSNQTGFIKIKPLHGDGAITFIYSARVTGNFTSVMTLDSTGAILNSKRYYSSPQIYFKDAIENNDNTITLCGYQEYPGFPYPEVRFILMKVSSTLNVLWTKQFKYRHQDAFESIALYVDGGYLIQGRSFDSSSTASRYDVCVFKTDSLGNMQWAKQCGNINPLLAVPSSVLTGKIKSQSNGNIVNVFSSNWYSGNNQQDIILQKLDSTGNEILTMQYEFGTYDHANDFMEESNGDFVIPNISSFFKTDSLFNYKWAKATVDFPITGIEIMPSVFQTNTGGFSASARITNGNKSLGYFFIADSTGNMFCHSNFQFPYFNSQRPVPSIDILNNMFDSTVIVTNSNINFTKQYLPILDSVYCQSATSIVGRTQNSSMLFSVYPTITINHIIIENYDLKNFDYHIFNTLGKEILSEKNISNRIKKINIETLTNGLYILNILTHHSFQSFKFIKQ